MILKMFWLFEIIQTKINEKYIKIYEIEICQGEVTSVSVIT